MSNQDILPVFRIVDGKRVPVPGNVRDPNRRYSLVMDAQLDEQYELELTDEQERQRDKEEKRWEAERPLREAEDRKQQEEASRFRESLVYEQRIVAFIDVLGWSASIDESVKYPEKAKNLGVALNGLSLAADMITGKIFPDVLAKQGWPGNPQVTQFSDSILLSIRDDRFAEHHLHSSLRHLMTHFQHSGLIVRGGVSVGLIIHRENMVFGPALIRAHELESKVARMPRIVLDYPLTTAWGSGPVVQDRDGKFLGHEKHWRRDEDGWWFFDFLQPLGNRPGIDDPSTGSVNAQMMPWRTLISERLEQYRDSEVRPKYEWLAKYFNAVICELPTCTLEIISV